MGERISDLLCCVVRYDSCPYQFIAIAREAGPKKTDPNARLLLFLRCCDSLNRRVCMLESSRIVVSSAGCHKTVSFVS